LQAFIASQTASDVAVASASVSLSTGNGNVGLHGSANSNAPSGGTYQTGSQAYASFDLYSYDEFNITGSGAETFQYTLTLDGNASLVGDPPTDDGASLAHGGLSLYANSSYQAWGTATGNGGCSGYYYELDGNNCGVISFAQLTSYDTNDTTVTGDVRFQGGTSVELGLFLWGRTQVYNFSFEDPGSPDIQAEFNAQDTGYFTLTPITPGASFTTSSGLTYAAAPDLAPVPEASTTWLLAAALGATAIRFRKWRAQ
jgi:hypothetical protein